MNGIRVAAILVFALACAGLPARAQWTKQKHSDPAAAAAQQGPQAAPRTMDEVIQRIVQNEARTMKEITSHQPLVETYIQNLKPDKELGFVPAGDKYFIGRADFSKGVSLIPLTENSGKNKKFLGGIGNFFSFALEFLPDGFLQMIFLDNTSFDREHYQFDFVKREFLGEVRCLVFDLTPQKKAGKGLFRGRVWVEDQGFNIVRFNGGYEGGKSTEYFHFDSWRTNVQPGLWMPTFVYSEERNLRFAVSKRLDFRAQTRLWGYNVGHASQEQELNRILVETAVNDESQSANDLSPIQAQRQWDRQAEQNVADRLERIGVLAPRGEVDKVLETVVNNLEVTNNLDIQPEIICRVLMTTTLESYTMGHTIVLSRGLIDVLPDEASLATILAHELGHVILGHRLDSNYAFFDQLLIPDKDTFRHFYFARTPAEELDASKKGLELLKNSPYKDHLGNAGLFLAAIEKRAKEIPNLVSPHLGDRVPLIADLNTASPAEGSDKSKQITALPIGGRVKIDPWDDKLSLIKSKPLGTLAEREKMPLEVTPFMPYLVRYGSVVSKQPPAQAAAAAPPAAEKPAEQPPSAPGSTPAPAEKPKDPPPPSR
jgi:hypothetical protein